MIHIRPSQCQKERARDRHVQQREKTHTWSQLLTLTCSFQHSTLVRGRKWVRRALARVSWTWVTRDERESTQQGQVQGKCFGKESPKSRWTMPEMT